MSRHISAVQQLRQTGSPDPEILSNRRHKFNAVPEGAPSPRRLPALTTAAPRRRKRKKKVAPSSSGQPPVSGRSSNSLLQVMSDANCPPTLHPVDWDEVDGSALSSDLTTPSFDLEPSLSAAPLPPLVSPSPSPSCANGGVTDFPPPPPAGSTPRSRHHHRGSGDGGPLFEKRKDPLLHHRASATHRQVIHEVRHQQRHDRLVAEQRRQHLRLIDNSCILEEVGESEEDSFDIGPVVPDSRFECSDSATDQPPSVATTEKFVGRERARQRWDLIRDKLDEVRDERSSTQAMKGWNMFVKHVRAMSDMEKARQDLYSRYGVFARRGCIGGASSPTLRSCQRLDHSPSTTMRRSAGFRQPPNDDSHGLHPVNL